MRRKILSCIFLVSVIFVLSLLLGCRSLDKTADHAERPTEEPLTEAPEIDLFELPIPSGDYILTEDNLCKLGSENNIIYFVIDRFDYEYYERARNSAPEIFYNLDFGGFTYFDNSISLYPRTCPSITYMITGVENDFSLSRNDYFAKAYSRSDFIRALYSAGYGINIYTDSYYGYSNASYMANYASNVKKQGDGAAYSTDMRDVYNYINQDGLSIEGGKNYSFIHISGTHMPLLYDENFEPLSEGDSREWNSTLGMKQSFKIINRYIDEMKRLGVYDNATIIITGDHASIGSDSAIPLKWAYVTPLFVKKAGVSGGELETSSAPVCHEDIFATILESEKINTDVYFGKSVFDFAEDEERVRKFYFQRYDKIDGKTNYQQYVYEVVGNARGYENWKLCDSYYLGKSIYD